MDSNTKADIMRNVADEMKAEQIETLDVRHKTSIADFFVVCSGTSDRHVESIAEKVAERLADDKIKAIRSEGQRSGWVLLDYGDVVLHVMRDEQRQFYDLESLWNAMQPSTDLP